MMRQGRGEGALLRVRSGGGVARGRVGNLLSFTKIVTPHDSLFNVCSIKFGRLHKRLRQMFL